MTRAEFGDDEASHLDFAELWVASGRTIQDLANVLTQRLFPAAEGQPPADVIYREALSKYLSSLERAATEGTLARARARGAHALAEASVSLADTATKDTASAVGVQVRSRQWLAERWNAAEFGQQKVGVSVNIGTLMLDALRQPLPARIAIPGAIAEEADVVSIEAPTTSEAEQ